MFIVELIVIKMLKFTTIHLSSLQEPVLCNLFVSERFQNMVLCRELYSSKFYIHMKSTC